jgi:uncharacterized damage-inducible protein DinB
MSEVERIQDQMTRAFEADAWHGPAVLEVLEGVSAEQAARKPIPAAHSIWELVLHMTAWKDVVVRRLGGDPVREVPPEVDFPPVTDPGAAAWREALEGLSASHQRLLGALRSVRDAQLDEPSPGYGLSRYVLLHGVIQHDLYHAGQIAILRKG